MTVSFPLDGTSCFRMHPGRRNRPWRIAIRCSNHPHRTAPDTFHRPKTCQLSRHLGLKRSCPKFQRIPNSRRPQNTEAQVLASFIVQIWAMCSGAILYGLAKDKNTNRLPPHFLSGDFPGPLCQWSLHSCSPEICELPETMHQWIYDNLCSISEVCVSAHRKKCSTRSAKKKTEDSIWPNQQLPPHEVTIPATSEYAEVGCLLDKHQLFGQCSSFFSCTCAARFLKAKQGFWIGKSSDYLMLVTIEDGMATAAASTSSVIAPRTTKRQSSVAGPFTAPIRKRKHSYFSMSFKRLLEKSEENSSDSDGDFEIESLCFFLTFFIFCNKENTT